VKLWQIFLVLLLFFLPSQLGRHFWPAYSYVFGLKIDYLSPTLYLTDILLGLTFVFWLKENSKIKKIKIKKVARNQSFMFTLLLLFLISNTLLARNTPLAFLKSLRVLELFFWALLVYKEGKVLIKTMGSTFPWLVITQFLISFLQFLKGRSLGGIFWFLGERTFSLSTPGIAKMDLGGQVFLRPYGTFSHPNAMAGFILICLIFLAGKENKKLIDFLSIGFGLVVISLSFSRTVWLTGLFLITITSFFNFFKKILVQKKPFLGWVKLFIVVAALIFLFVGIYSSLEKETISRRVELNKIALYFVKKFPVFGLGLNNFIPELASYLSLHGGELWLQPIHNLYLLILTETGIIGLSFFLVMNLLYLKKIISRQRVNLMIVWLAVLLTGLTDHYWLTLQQNFLLLGLVFGLGFG
jgi:O-antigen ligase